MDKLLRLIIADDEYYICGMLAKIIRFDELGLELAGSVCDGQSLFSMIAGLQPDIVVTDISMPGMDGLEVIRRSREAGFRTSFILISGYRQFEYAYSALKYGVEDYIMKPVDEEQLNGTLSAVAERIRREQTPRTSVSEQSLREFFLSERLLEELSRKPMPLERINRIYATRFTPGAFRAMMVKLDPKNGGEISPAALVALRQQLETCFTGCCSDILFEDKRDGVMLLANYPQELSWRFEAAADSFSSAANETPELREFFVTPCLSHPSDDPSGLLRAKEEARAAEWSRLIYGVGRALRPPEAAAEELMLFRERLRELGRETRKAFSILSGEAFRAEMAKFFSFQPELLAQYDALLFLLHVRDSFFEVNGDSYASVGDPDALRARINVALHNSCSPEKLRAAYTPLFSDALALISAGHDAQQLRPVRVAIAYVEANYSAAITLESAAREVHLNAAYFSKLFKRETGKNFSEYVTDVRMEHARELLRGGEMNIGEIADAVGFSDARYFSKTFKKLVGVKPSEYREMRG